jgi:hypothetical protein
VRPNITVPISIARDARLEEERHAERLRRQVRGSDVRQECTAIEVHGVAARRAHERNPGRREALPDVAHEAMR